MKPQIKVFLGAVLIVLGIYWYALDPSISSATNLDALAIMFQGFFGVFIFLLGFFTVWINSDEMRIQREIEQADFEPSQYRTGDEFAEEETPEVTIGDEEYRDIVSGTVADVKDRVKEDDDLDIGRLLQAEKDGKDRKTLKQWLQRRVED